MKTDINKFLILGYILLLFVNCLEFRSGYILSLSQLFLGLLAFLPRLNSNNSWNNNLLLAIEVLYVLSLISGVYLHYFSLPNHFFLFITITLVLLISRQPRHLSYVENNLRWVFIILMGFATIHKLIEPTFINGDFAGYMLMKGSFFHHILDSGLFPEIQSSIDANNAILSELEKTDPALGDTLFLNIKHLPLNFLIKGLTIFIIVAELLLTLLFIFFPRRKNTLLFLLIFVCSIMLVTVELEFQSTLLFMGFVMCPVVFSGLKKAYKYTFILFALSAILNNFKHLL
ncbi:hypothetical protein [Flavivirga spongiicola]|uniref:O-antigen ligase domain-containing protein n=1 Tax=Flavivirga spongiicola TaxID=421621 RepID=A0ABU7XMK0_9FLAO|nr:hypothetical protein [Flavivirga sp. MEBiC05379]MDO5981641.1 hypothetical protein [Flavivirga sp. MEBiC05379]